MKTLTVFFFTFILSTQAFAFVRECVSDHPKIDGKIIVNTGSIPITVTIEFDGVVVFDKVAVVEGMRRNTQTFNSPTFINKNGAPSSLSVSIEYDGQKSVGRVSEVSFVPEIPSFGGACQQIF